jgi:hypothetical protein
MAVKDHLHSSSDVQEVVSSTIIPGQQKKDWHMNATESMKVRSALAPMSFVWYFPTYIFINTSRKIVLQIFLNFIK